MDAELVAKIVLADIEDLRQSDAIRPGHSSADAQREHLADEIRHLLSYIGRGG
jgi:hypothetical protein